MPYIHLRVRDAQIQTRGERMIGDALHTGHAEFNIKADLNLDSSGFRLADQPFGFSTFIERGLLVPERRDGPPTFIARLRIARLSNEFHDNYGPYFPHGNWVRLTICALMDGGQPMRAYEAMCERGLYLPYGQDAEGLHPVSETPAPLIQGHYHMRRDGEAEPERVFWDRIQRANAAHAEARSVRYVPTQEEMDALRGAMAAAGVGDDVLARAVAAAAERAAAQIPSTGIQPKPQPAVKTNWRPGRRKMFLK